MQRHGLLDAAQSAVEGLAGRDTARQVGHRRAPITVRVAADAHQVLDPLHGVGPFHPACRLTDAKVPFGISSPRWPLIVTRPGLSECLNCRWLPFDVTSVQPSASRSRITSRTFTRRRYHSRRGASVSGSPWWQAPPHKPTIHSPSICSGESREQSVDLAQISSFYRGLPSLRCGTGGSVVPAGAGLFDDTRDVGLKQVALAHQIGRSLADERQILLAALVALLHRSARIAHAVALGARSREGNERSLHAR